MKVWDGYGSEHSMNLVLIGKFKEALDAEKAKKAIDALMQRVAHEDAESHFPMQPQDLRYSDEMMKLLSKLALHILSPEDIEQLRFDHDVKLHDNQITVETDEADVSVFLKIFVEGGAKVEVFSWHDYPSAAAPQR